jgi:nucleoside-diphosphate-sugar epimerase
MKIIVTGGNGFLGSNLIRKLLLEGHTVYAFSNQTANILDILDQIKFDFSHTGNLSSFEDEIKAFEPDIVVHCGWSGGNSYADINNIDQFYENVDPSITLVQLLSTLKKKPKFVGFGSFAEYGEMTNPVNETVQEVPTNLYGLSKYTFKKYSEMLCNEHNIEWVWVRPCYVYGPGDVHTRLIPRVVEKFLNNEAVILDECTSIVDYIYIDDFVNSIYLLILSKSTGVFNICSGKQYRVRDIIEQLYKQTGSNSSIEFNTSLKRTSTYSYICGDRAKLDKAVGVLEQISLSRGLEEVIKNVYNKLIQK